MSMLTCWCYQTTWKRCVGHFKVEKNCQNCLCWTNYVMPTSQGYLWYFCIATSCCLLAAVYPNSDISEILKSAANIYRTAVLIRLIHTIWVSSWFACKKFSLCNVIICEKLIRNSLTVDFAPLLLHLTAVDHCRQFSTAVFKLRYLHFNL